MGTPEIRREMIRVNGQELFCLTAGNGTRTMLCLHGMYGRAESWLDLMSRYAGRYRVIAPDQRGHGLSGKALVRYAGEDMADDAAALLEHFGGQPALVVGHSMGGRNAAFLAVRRPDLVRALAILDMGAGGATRMSECPPDQVPAADGFTADWPLPFATRRQALEFLASKLATPVAVDYFAASLVETPAGYDLLFSRRAMAAINLYWRSWEDLATQIRCPVLLARAAQSWCLSETDATKLRGLLSNASYVEISKSDHNVHLDNPDEFYPAFDRFIESI